LQAALSAGADAVYLGLDTWSARAFAGNFAPAALPAAIDRAHLFGARVHLALNVLLKDDELAPALAALEAPYRAGLDALIVADLGFATLVHEAYPDLELHASTQLDTHSSAQLELLAGLGFTRAILARELSLDEIAALDPHGLALEAFIHGALCYGYSGACLLSSMASGRSGNRGRCSQACRMRYRLTEGRPRGGSGPGIDTAARADTAADGGEPHRVLSTADLAAISALPALLTAGVTSFKIEGRMKDAAYVAVTTAVYREALDAALADPDGFTVLPQWLSRLEQSFSRGFTTAHLEGDHAAVRSGGRGGHRGVQVGRVEAVDEAGGKVTVRVVRDLNEADVVQIYTIWGSTQPTRLAALLAGGRPGDERLVLRLSERVSVKDRVFRTSSGQMDAFAADALAGRALARPIALSAALDGRRGERPRLRLSAGGQEVVVEGGAPLEAALTAALSADKARRAIGALGGTPYELRGFEFTVQDGVFLGVGDLKALRRAALSELDERRLAGRRRAASLGPLSPPASLAPLSPPARQSARRPRRCEPPLGPSGVPRRRSFCACARARSRSPGKASMPCAWICEPATTSSSLLRPGQPLAAAAFRYGCARPRCCSTPTSPGPRPWRPWGGMPYMPVTSRRLPGRTRCFWSTRCRG
jgi:putative protease